MSCSDDEDTAECPLCCAELDLTDRSIQYCDCGYQMCLWCYHHILEEAGKENLPARCPNCRTLYDQGKIQMQHIDAEQLAEEKRRIKGREKPRAGSSASTAKARAGLANVRVVQPNLVYAVGLPIDTCQEETLRSLDFFGQYGRIVKISVNRGNQFASALARHGPTGSAYVTFRRGADALRCIRALDGGMLRGKPIKACFGTTKYCNAFLKGLSCNNPDCLYLHTLADEADCLTKEEVAAGLLPQRFMAMGAHNTFRPRLTIHSMGPGGTAPRIAMLPRALVHGLEHAAAAGPGPGAGLEAQDCAECPAREGGVAAGPPGLASVPIPPPPPPLQPRQDWPELGGGEGGVGGPWPTMPGAAPVATAAAAGAAPRRAAGDAGPSAAAAEAPDAKLSPWVATVAAAPEAKAAKKATVPRKPHLVPLPSPGKVKAVLASPRPSAPPPAAHRPARVDAGPADPSLPSGCPLPAEAGARCPTPTAAEQRGESTAAVAAARRLVAPPGFENWDLVRAPGSAAGGELAVLPGELGFGHAVAAPPPPLAAGRRQQSRFAFAQGVDPAGGEGPRSLLPPPGLLGPGYATTPLPPPRAPASVPPGFALLQQLRLGAGGVAPPQAANTPLGPFPFPDPAVMEAQRQLARPPPPPGFDLRT